MSHFQLPPQALRATMNTSASVIAVMTSVPELTLLGEYGRLQDSAGKPTPEFLAYLGDAKVKIESGAAA